MTTINQTVKTVQTAATEAMDFATMGVRELRAKAAQLGVSIRENGAVLRKSELVARLQTATSNIESVVLPALEAVETWVQSPETQARAKDATVFALTTMAKTANTLLEWAKILLTLALGLAGIGAGWVLTKGAEHIKAQLGECQVYCPKVPKVSVSLIPHPLTRFHWVFAPSLQAIQVGLPWVNHVVTLVWGPNHH